MAEIEQQFIQVKTKSNFETRLKAGDIKDTSIAFIEDSDQIWAKGKYYSAIPKEGQESQILAWKANGEAKWEYLADMFTGLEEILAYGVQFDITVADPHLTRIGNMSFHKSLPIQSQLKGCIAQGGKVIYWLNESDWRFRKEPITKSVKLTVADDVYTITDDIFNTLQYDKQWIRIKQVPVQINSIDTSTGTATLLVPDELKGSSISSIMPIELGAVLNGYDGTVRVYCPAFYIKSTVEGNVSKVWLSTSKINDTYTYQPEILVDAYRSTVLNSVPENMGYLSTLPVNSAISVVNTNAYCRGGINRSDYDQYLTTDPFRTDLGKPLTNLSRSSMRTYSRNAKSQVLSYDQYKNIFYWLYVVEYANFNSQEDYNATLTDEGYRQGGIGVGITNMANWKEYNKNCPLTPCGYGNILGNRTDLIPLVIPDTDDGIVHEQSMSMPRWRGFDNPFGDIYTTLDGIIIDTDVNNHSDSMNYVYTCQDASKYADTLNDSYVKVGETPPEDGFTRAFNLGDAAHIIPSLMGGDSTKYICDYHYIGRQSEPLRTLLVGGYANNSTKAGLSCLNLASYVSFAWEYAGFRSVSDFVSFPSGK